MDTRISQILPLVAGAFLMVITTSCTQAVVPCRGGLLDNRYFTRAEPIETIRFARYCITNEKWGMLYETLSGKTRDEVPWLGFWLEIESVKWPGTDRYLVEILGQARIYGISKNPGNIPENVVKVGVGRDNIAASVWLVKEDRRWRIALWEMKEHVEKTGTLD